MIATGVRQSNVNGVADAGDVHRAWTAIGIICGCGLDEPDGQREPKRRDC
jgi:hypothetical protein